MRYSAIRYVWAFVYAAILGGIVIGYEVGIFQLVEYIFESHGRPVGPGWVVTPFVFAMAGWRSGLNAPEHFTAFRLNLASFYSTIKGKVYLSLSLTWAISWFYILEFKILPDGLVYHSVWLTICVYFSGLMGIPLGIVIFIALMKA